MEDLLQRITFDKEILTGKPEQLSSLIVAKPVFAGDKIEPDDMPIT